jgi:hypothetical protein
MFCDAALLSRTAGTHLGVRGAVQDLYEQFLVHILGEIGQILR